MHTLSFSSFPSLISFFWAALTCTNMDWHWAGVETAKRSSFMRLRESVPLDLLVCTH